MAINIKDFEKLLKQKMHEALEEATKKSVLEEVKDSIINDIKKRVTLGYGVSKNGATKQKLKPLSDSYVSQRKGEAIFFKKGGKTIGIPVLKDSEIKDLRGSKAALKQNRENRKFAKANRNMGKNAKPKKSNLHRTGQMIEDDLGGKVIDTGNSKKIIIEMQTDRSKEAAEYVSKDRPFMNLSKGEIQRIVTFFRLHIAEIFRNKLKNL